MADLIETAVNAGNFTTLIKAIESVDLVELLKSEGSYTVFAPTDEAFSKLPQETLNSLLQDIPKLKRVLTYHIVFGDVREEDLKQIEEAATVEGSIVAIETNNNILVNDAQVLQTDIIADNGVIHVIDGVLIPALVAVE